MPSHVTDAIRARYSKEGKIIHRAELLNDADHTIVSRYQAVLQGIYNYYCMATNASRRMTTIRFILETSLTKTLAHKHKTSVAAIYRKYKVNTTPTSLVVTRPDPTNHPLSRPSAVSRL